MSAADTPPPPGPWKRRLRRGLIALGVLIAVVAVLVYFAPTVVARTSLRDRVVDAAAGQINGTLTIESMSLGWFSPVVLHGVTVTDPAGRKTLEATTVRTSRTLLGLARDRADLGTVTVEKPVVRIICEHGTTNLEQVFEKMLADDGTAPSAERSAVVLVAADGRVTLTDAARPGDHLFEPVNATVTVPRARAEAVAVEVTATAPDPITPGDVQAHVSTGPTLTAKLTARQFPLGSLAPLVERYAPGTTAGGRLTGAAEFERKPVGDGSAELTLHGNLAVADLDAAGPWSRGDRVKMAHAEVKTASVSLVKNEITMKDTVFTCDAGTLSATAAVSLVEPVAELFTTPGLQVDARIDVAKLAAVAPRLMRLREGTKLTAGQVTAKVTSIQGPHGVAWAGDVSATALHGERAGRPLAWDKPLHLAFAGHLRGHDHLPVFDKLECEADFVGLAARGSAEAFLVEARLDLDTLAKRLADFVDLKGVTLGGSGRLAVKNDPLPGGGFQIGMNLEVEKFRYADAQNHLFEVPLLKVTAAAVGAHGHGKPLRLDRGNLTVTAGPDRVTADLVEPVADLKKSRLGKVQLGLAGDLGRWRERAGQFAPIPAEWVIAGTGPVAATVAVRADGVTVEKATADLRNVRFAGAGVDLNEPELKVETGAAWDRTTKIVTLSNVKIDSPTLTVTTPKLTATPTPTGTTIATDAQVSADVNRLQRLFKLEATPGDGIHGRASGPVKLATAGGTTTFDADLRVTDFKYGLPAKPTWHEPWVTVKAAGTYDPATDAVTIPTLALGREGITLTGQAKVTHLSAACTLDSAGTVAYDMARLEPTLKELIGATATARGQGTKPYHVRGDLGGGGSTLAKLTADAGLSWTTLKAYGFEVGPADATLGLKGGDLSLTPVTATFGGGTARVEPKVSLISPGYPMTLTPGKLIDRAKLTPEALASAVGYVLPAFANAAQASGEMSFTLAENRIPLTAINSTTAKGTLTVHQADVSAGPLLTKIAEVLGAERTSMTLSKEQAVPVRVENGRVHHEKFEITVGKEVIVSSGSVGLDKTVAITLDMPLPQKYLGHVLAKNPRVREALAKQRVKVPVGGTLSQPVIDPRGVEQYAQTLIRDVARDVAKSAAGDVEDKVRDRVRQEIERKLGGKLPFPLPGGPPKR